MTGTVQKITPTAPKFAEAMRRSAIYGGLSAGVTQPSGVGGQQNELEYAILAEWKARYCRNPHRVRFMTNHNPPGQTSMVPRHSTLGWSGCGIRPTMWQAHCGRAAVDRRRSHPLGIGGEQVSAQQVEMQSKARLVRALQQNPRYAEVNASLSKGHPDRPRGTGNPTAYRLRLVEIGKYIQEELQFQSQRAQRTPQVPRFSSDSRLNSPRQRSTSSTANSGCRNRSSRSRGQKTPPPSSLMRTGFCAKCRRSVMARRHLRPAGFGPGVPGRRRQG